MLTLAAAQAQASTATPYQAALNEVAQQVLEDLAAQAQAKRIDVGLELLSAGPWSVAMHPVTLRELLTNLVDNALRNTPVGGVVTVWLESLPQQLLLSVEDNGPGAARAGVRAFFSHRRPRLRRLRPGPGDRPRIRPSERRQPEPGDAGRRRWAGGAGGAAPRGGGA